MIKPTQRTITFEDFLLSLNDVTPRNTEHMQARARHIHNAALQIVADGPFKSSVRTTFPILKKPETMTDTEIAQWWGRFGEWMDSLTHGEWRALNATIIVLPSAN